MSWPLAIGWLASACGGGDLVLPRDGAATAIRVVDGDGQTGLVGQPLRAPVVIEVTNRGGEPVEGAIVEFALTSAGLGAEVAPATVATSAQGRAEAHVLLGDKIGLQTGEARVQGSTALSASFSAVALTNDNHAPDAGFDWQCDALDCEFSDASTDDDGSVTGWTWDFGDGATSAERDPSHRYAAAGTYTVALTVTDDEGAGDGSSERVTASAPSTPPPETPPESPPTPPSNAAPDADFGIACDGLRCTFTDRSSDRDGSVVRWLWSFGDGATSSEPSPSHTYPASGRFEVRLVVTDDDGAEDRRTRSARPDEPPPPEEPPPTPEEPPPPPPPPPPANAPPRAEFGVQCQELLCVFADRSTDGDGNIASWSWDFGDGATSSERNPSHTYAAPGRYDVLLTVTDDDGATGIKSHRAEPKGPAPNRPPHADFDVRCEGGLTCSFGDRSKDDDGVIVSWQWTFGDGASSGERNPVRTYSAPGRYEVLLTVTDDAGGSDARSRHADPKN